MLASCHAILKQPLGPTAVAVSDRRPRPFSCTRPRAVHIQGQETGPGTQAPSGVGLQQNGQPKASCHRTLAGKGKSGSRRLVRLVDHHQRQHNDAVSSWTSPPRLEGRSIAVPSKIVCHASQCPPPPPPAPHQKVHFGTCVCMSRVVPAALVCGATLWAANVAVACSPVGPTWPSASGFHDGALDRADSITTGFVAVAVAHHCTFALEQAKESPC